MWWSVHEWILTVSSSRLWPQQTDGLASRPSQHRTDGWRVHPPSRWTRSFRKQLCYRQTWSHMCSCNCRHSSHFLCEETLSCVKVSRDHNTTSSKYSSPLISEVRLNFLFGFERSPCCFPSDVCRRINNSSSFCVKGKNTVIIWSLNVKTDAVADWLLDIFICVCDSGMRRRHSWWW